MSTADPHQDLDPRLARALNELREEVERRFAALRTELGLTVGSGEVERPAAPDYGALLDVVRRLDAAQDQAELLGRMLEGAGRFAGRALFLLVRGEEIEGWGGYGFPPEAAGEVRGELSRLDSVETCVRRGETVPLSAEQCRRLLGADAGAPEEGVLVPFPLRGSVAAVLYADRGPGQALTTPALELLVYSTAHTLETLPLRRSVEETAATAPPAVEAPEPEPVAAKEPEAAPREDDSGAAATELVAEEEEEGDGAEATVEPVAAAAVDEDTQVPVEGPETASPAPGPLDTLSVARSAVEVAEPPGTEELPEAAGMREPGEADLGPLGERGSGGSIEVAPPPDLEGPGWAFRDRRVSADEGRREEARRLARLLVTEIKLYNEEQVEEGLERGNLYATLQEEIDRSRRIFEERVPADVRAQADYFRDELVRILADGDSSALGI